MASQKRNNRAMNKKLAARLMLDLAMTILLLCAYAYRVIGDAAHEWIGVSVFALFITHNILNWRWYKSIFKGEYTPRRVIMTAVNIALAFTMITLVITGLMQSRTAIAFLRLPGSMVLRQIHTTAAYWGLPLIGVHMGLHWGMFTRIISKNRIIITSARVFAFVFAAFGVWSSFDRDMFSKLFLGFSFDYWPEERPAILFFAVTLSIMAVYIFAAYYALKWLERRAQR
jgi:hypothetical protein